MGDSWRLRMKLLANRLLPLALRRIADEPLDQPPILGVGPRHRGVFGNMVLPPSEQRAPRRHEVGEPNEAGLPCSRGPPPAPRLLGPRAEPCPARPARSYNTQVKP